MHPKVLVSAALLLMAFCVSDVCAQEYTNMPCKVCGGTGYVITTDGLFQYQEVCPNCDGSGVEPYMILRDGKPVRLIDEIDRIQQSVPSKSSDGGGTSWWVYALLVVGVGWLISRLSGKKQQSA